VAALAAERLIAAARNVTATAPVRDVLGCTDVALAYDVQKVLTAARLAEGARIVGVTSGSPAAVAGLANGALITKVDDQVIQNAGTLCAAVQSQAPGARVTVGFVDPSGIPEPSRSPSALTRVSGNPSLPNMTVSFPCSSLQPSPFTPCPLQQ